MPDFLIHRSDTWALRNFEFARGSSSGFFCGVSYIMVAISTTYALALRFDAINGDGLYICRGLTTIPSHKRRLLPYLKAKRIAKVIYYLGILCEFQML